MSVDHAGYILAAYAITVLVVAGMIISLVLDHRALRRALSRLPARGAETD